MQKPQKHMFFGALTFGNRTGDPCVLATQARGQTGDPCFFNVFVMYWGPGQAQPNPGSLPGSCRAAAGQLPGSCRAAAGQFPGKITRGNVLSWQPWPLAIRGLNRTTSLTDAKRNEYVHAILISLIGLRKYMKKSCFFYVLRLAFFKSVLCFFYILTFL